MFGLAAGENLGQRRLYNGVLIVYFVLAKTIWSFQQVISLPPRLSRLTQESTFNHIVVFEGLEMIDQRQFGKSKTLI